MTAIIPTLDDYTVAQALSDMAATVQETDGGLDVLLERAINKGWLTTLLHPDGTPPTPDELAAKAAEIAPLFDRTNPDAPPRLKGRDPVAFLEGVVALTGAHAALTRKDNDGRSTRDLIGLARG